MSEASAKMQTQKNTDITLVFLHGFACHPEDFYAQLSFFKNTFDVLPINYSSFVANEKSTQTIFERCIHYIKNEIELYAKNKVILIGHSMGGIIATALAQSLENLIGLVIIDSSINTTKEASGKYDLLIEKMQHNDFEKILLEKIKTSMINSDIDNFDIMSKKAEDMLRVCNKSPLTFAALLKEASSFSVVKALSDIDIPILYIASYPGFASSDVLRKLNKNIEFKQIKSGHFIMLNQPEKLNELLLCFLKKYF